MEWELILADAVKDNKIRELHLSKVPVLKTADNWKNVEFLGWVDHEMKHSHYRGALVKVNGRLYFVKEATIKAIQQYLKWKARTVIEVVKD